ncbi:MAG: alpha-L-rhamnosidase N-terminal domain-containing protein, partial [Sedimentisphaerales bacterium]|nr:alpha-L-rhamnosidase N-terminal domain-containing protein [Sedimentisphaerales bacterium]
MSKLKWILTLGILGWLPVQLGCQVWDRITASGSAGRMKVTYLRIEYLENPLGIEAVPPRFSWLVTSSLRGQRQTAYRILVASDPDILKRDQGDLWDTGKVLSDRTSQVVYGGKPLDSRMACFWKVRAWDKDDRPTAWSTPAQWTMGLLGKEDWQAGWIGYDAPPPPSHQRQAASEAISLNDCPWIWFAQGQPRTGAPAGLRYFRREFLLADKPVAKARMLLSVDNELELFVNGRRAGSAAGWKPPKPLDLAGHLQAGQNALAIAAKNTDGPAGLAGKLVIAYADGSDQVIRIDSSWKASEQAADGWDAAGFDDRGWPAALKIAAVGDSPWGKLEADPLHIPPPPYLRKEFPVARPVRQATVYASALGIYELHLNGRRIGADYFTPGWTDYKKRVYYQAYDVTDALEKGDNALGAVLADGWYAGYVGFGRQRDHYGDAPRLMVQLELEYDDGTRQIVATDSSWKAAYGPLLEADFLMGETYDARLAQAGWT